MENYRRKMNKFSTAMELEKLNQNQVENRRKMDKLGSKNRVKISWTNEKTLGITHF